MHWYHIHGLSQDCSISIANAPEILQSCTKPSVCLCVFVWIKREYRLARFDQFFNWFYGISILLTDHPELRGTTQPSIMGGPLGDPGFCFFRSTVNDNLNSQKTPHTSPVWVRYGVSIVNTWVKTDHVLMALHCTWPVLICYHLIITYVIMAHCHHWFR